MSSGQGAPLTSNYQLIITALADYAQITGIDLSTNPFAAALEQSTSPEAILQLLQGRENAFKEYRDGNRRLISYLSPAVNVIQAFSGILGDAVSLVSHTCQRCHLVGLLTVRHCCQVPFPPANALLTGFDVLLAVRPLNFKIVFLQIYKYARLPVGIPPVTMRY